MNGALNILFTRFDCFSLFVDVKIKNKSNNIRLLIDFENICFYFYNINNMILQNK